MIPPLHAWSVSVDEALNIQKSLRDQVKLSPYETSPTYIGGTDISFNRNEDTFYAGIVVLDFHKLSLVSYSLITDKAPFPYIPGLLSFREIPALLRAWRNLEVVPDLVMLDGHGLAHPRRLGLASHFGLWIDKPTLGCAKKLLTGLHESPGIESPAHTPIYEKNEHIGFALRSRTKVKPIFVSPGHLMDQDSALSICLRCITRYRIPEPTRLAHQMVNLLRKGEIDAGAKSF